MRLFIGIPLPKTGREMLSEACGRLDRDLNSTVKWTAPENWHVTLKFLGPVEDERLPALTEALSSVAHAPFVMQPGKPVCFPNRKKPRVVGLSLARGEDETKALAQSVDAAVSSVGLPKETRPFKAHVTLGRVKKNGVDDWENVLGGLPEEWPEIGVDRFVLWESELTPTGPVYHRLHTFLLGA